MKITITFNLKPGPAPRLKSFTSKIPEDAFEEFDTPETIEAIASVFRKEGHTVSLVEAGRDFFDAIRKTRPDFVFNIAEGFEGRNRESHVPAILEFLGIPFSGSDAFALALSLDKLAAKIIARSQGIRTPDFSIVSFPRRAMPKGGNNKLFIKPLCEGSSKGIRFTSLVHNQKELMKECRRLRASYGPVPLMAEQFISGREITVGVLGTSQPQVLGLMEIRWKKPQEHGDFIYGLETKRNWKEWVEYEAPAPAPGVLKKEIETMAVRMHQALGCRDISRIDFRVDKKGKPYFLEINPLPGLSPEYSDLVLMMRRLGMSHHALVMAIFREALKRYPCLHR
ncbi:MAG: ATP-grasp domain-containing protein [Candidatus Omnitrophica bacterium]|nr:ATP-grasp domain-containing protein [Candidatus Omnitrophota bacterium]